MKTPLTKLTYLRRLGAVALVGCADGTLHRLDVTSGGAMTVTPCLRPWEEDMQGSDDVPAAQSASSTPGQLLGRATRSAMSLLRASGKPPPVAAVVTLCWTDAPELASSTRACALVLTEQALEAWTIPISPIAGGQHATTCVFSRGALASAQSALRDNAARLLSCGAVPQGGVLLVVAAAGSVAAPHALWLMHCATEAEPRHGGLTLLRSPVALAPDAVDALRITVPRGVVCSVCDRNHAMVLNLHGDCAAVISSTDGALQSKFSAVTLAGAAVLAGDWSHDAAAAAGGALMDEARLLTSAGLYAAQPPVPAPAPAIRGAQRCRDGGAAIHVPALLPGASASGNAVMEAFQAGSTDLEPRLAAGCFEGDSNAFAVAMQRILDTLPKRWGDISADSERAHAATVLQQLVDKGNTLRLFLDWCAGSGAWQQCHPPTRAAMLAAVEQLGAAVRLREFCNDLQGGSGGASAVRDVLAAAGTSIPAGPDAAPRHPVDGVFEQPSHMHRFFDSASVALQAMNQAGGGMGDVESRWDAASAVCGAMLAVLQGAYASRATEAARYPSAQEAPLRWTASPSVINALKAGAAAAAVCASASSMAKIALCDITTYLLDCAAAARDAETPDTPQRVQLHAQYSELRAWLLPALLSAAAIQEGGRTSEPPSHSGNVSLDAVVQLAVQHSAYDTLYDICAVTGNWSHLQDWMHQLKGSAPDHESPFSGTVFTRLRDDGRIRHLLDGLPHEWDEPLRQFLGDAPHFGWMHALRLADFNTAAQLLMRVGTAAAPPATAAHPALSALDALRLAKLSYMAAGLDDSHPVVVAADAACELRSMQADVLPGGVVELMPPATLAEALLNAEHMEHHARPLAALRVFLASSAHVRAQHATLMRRIWVQAAQLTDWAAVAAAKGTLADDAYISTLADTPLALAADACFAPDRLVMEPPFARPGEVCGVEELSHLLIAELCQDNQMAAQSIADALAVGAEGWEMRMVIADAEMD